MKLSKITGLMAALSFFVTQLVIISPASASTAASTNPDGSYSPVVRVGDIVADQWQPGPEEKLIVEEEKVADEWHRNIDEELKPKKKEEKKKVEEKVADQWHPGPNHNKVPSGAVGVSSQGPLSI